MELYRRFRQLRASQASTAATSSSPKKDGSLRPILDLRHLNCALMRQPFRMITLKQILSQVCPGDWFFSLDLKDAYFHIQIAPPPQTVLEIRLQGSVSGSVHCFGLSLAPHTFTKSPSEADGNPHSQLPRRLACLGPVGGRINIAQDSPPQSLGVPGTQGQFRQEHAVPQPANIVPGNSSRLGSDAVVTPECARAIQKLVASFE